MSRHLRGERGYTVTELLVVAAIVAFIMSGLFVTLRTGQQTFIAGTNRAEAQQNTRLTLSRMVYELRTAGYDPLRNGSFNAVTALAAGTGFVLRNDWNQSGAIETGVTQTVDGVTHGEQITYTFSGTTLTRRETGVDATPVTVTNRISSVTIEYRDADGNIVASPSGVNAGLIRTVVLDITTSPDTTTAGTATQANVRSRTQVRIRNR